MPAIDAIIVFTDLVNAVRMFEKVDDAKAVERLSRLERHARSVTEEHGGDFVKTTGDGHILLFGSPASAVAAARGLHGGAERLALELRDSILLRVAIGSGAVQRVPNDVFGQAVNLTARMLSITGPAETSITAAEHRRLPDDVRASFAAHGPEMFKGLTRIIRVFKEQIVSAETIQTMRLGELDDGMTATIEGPVGGRSSYELRLDHPTAASHRIRVEEGDVHVIGRAAESDTTVPDPAVSSRHAALGVVEGCLWIFDLDSSNGLHLSGNRIRRRHLLWPGAVVDLPRGSLTVLDV